MAMSRFGRVVFSHRKAESLGGSALEEACRV
jgi:hypothetical protein